MYGNVGNAPREHRGTGLLIFCGAALRIRKIFANYKHSKMLHSKQFAQLRRCGASLQIRKIFAKYKYSINCVLRIFREFAAIRRSGADARSTFMRKSGDVLTFRAASPLRRIAANSQNLRKM